MTITEVSNQLYGLAVNHEFNGEKFTKKRLNSYISGMFSVDDNDLYMTILMNDGSWLFKIFKYGKEKDAFDYDIPDTREKEQKYWDVIINKARSISEDK